MSPGQHFFFKKIFIFCRSWLSFLHLHSNKSNLCLVRSWKTLFKQSLKLIKFLWLALSINLKNIRSNKISYWYLGKPYCLWWSRCSCSQRSRRLLIMRGGHNMKRSQPRPQAHCHAYWLSLLSDCLVANVCSPCMYCRIEGFNIS